MKNNNQSTEDYAYAVRLATILRDRYYPHVQDWQPLDTLNGVLSQIDNMIVGLTKPKLTMRDLALRHTEQGLPAAANPARRDEPNET